MDTGGLSMYTRTRNLRRVACGIVILASALSLIVSPTHSSFAEVDRRDSVLRTITQRIYHIYKARPSTTMAITATAYSSTPDQTDATPCVSANGYDLCLHNRENIVATNMLPFGTKI